MMEPVRNELDEKNSNLEKPPSGTTIDGPRNISTNAESDNEPSAEQLEADGEGLTTAIDQYPTGFRHVIIIVALILNIFLVVIFFVSSIVSTNAD